MIPCKSLDLLVNGSLVNRGLTDALKSSRRMFLIKGGDLTNCATLTCISTGEVFIKSRRMPSKPYHIISRFNVSSVDAILRDVIMDGFNNSKTRIQVGDLLTERSSIAIDVQQRGSALTLTN